MMRRLLTVAFLAAAMCVLPAASALAKFPSKRVVIVVPHTPGGLIDMLARAFAVRLGKLWGQPVVVENLPGAGAIIGVDKVVHSAPDGYTLMVALDPAVVSNRFLYKHLPYDPDKDLTPITMIAESGIMAVANPKFPADNIHQLVADARKHPGRIAYASYGIGTQPNLLYETIAKHEGVHFLHVPYKGSAPMLRATVSGQVQLTAGSPGVEAGLVRAGKLRPLAVTGQHRSILFPKVPTFAQAGYPYVKSSIWFALFGPGGMNPKLANRINRDVVRIARRPAFVKKYISHFGLNLIADTRAQFVRAIRADVKVTAEMVKAAGVKPR